MKFERSIDSDICIALTMEDENIHGNDGTIVIYYCNFKCHLQGSVNDYR